MADAPALRAYIVALSFTDGGPICATALIAPSPEAAAALWTHRFIREHQPQQQLGGVVVAELDAGFMRDALRAVEGKLPPSGNAEVLSLVPKGAEPPQAQIQIGLDAPPTVE